MKITAMHTKEKKAAECTVNDKVIQKLHFKSRKNMFSKIIKKYSRPVKRRDIIDLNTLTIVEDGGYVRRMKPRPFAYPSSFFSKDSIFHKANEEDFEKQSISTAMHTKEKKAAKRTVNDEVIQKLHFKSRKNMFSKIIKKTSPQKTKTSELSSTFLEIDNIDCNYPKNISSRIPLDCLSTLLNDSLNNSVFDSGVQCSTPIQNKTKAKIDFSYSPDKTTCQNSSETKGSNNSGNSYRKSNKICLSMSNMHKTEKVICRSPCMNPLPYPKSNKNTIAVIAKSPLLNKSGKLLKAVNRIVSKQSNTPKRIKNCNYNISEFVTLQDIEKKFTNMSFHRCSTPVKRDWSPKVKKQLSKIEIDDITLYHESYDLL